MPRVTITVMAPGQPNDTDMFTLDLPPGITIKDLKTFIEGDANLPAAAQQLLFNGRPLNSELQTLEEAGINDGEMLVVRVRQAGSQRQQQAPSRGPQGDPEAVRQGILSDPAAQQQLRGSAPQLFSALNDPARWREIFTMLQRREQEAGRERDAEIARLNEDPFNEENQRKIMEIIRQENVIENLQHAYEHNPEVFVRVHMLYINTEVNGVPVKAFVDSGAQATIMSPDCAERCNIMRLIDKRYSGIAKGVGTAQILGRVHHAEIKIGGAVMPCAFTVMEGKDVDLLFGLDMLKRYKAKIDLEKNALCFEGIEVPFLPESEIPKSLEEAMENEPTVQGPNGVKIGGISGAVKADGTSDAGPSQAASAPAPAQAAAAPPKPSGPEFPPEHIEQLVNLGFSRPQAIQALRATGGNLDQAASLLFAEM